MILELPVCFGGSSPGCSVVPHCSSSSHSCAVVSPHGCTVVSHSYAVVSHSYAVVRCCVGVVSPHGYTVVPSYSYAVVLLLCCR